MTLNPLIDHASRRIGAALLFVAATLLGLPTAKAATPQDLLTGYNTQAGTPALAARGQAFFTAKHGKEWSCSTCHGDVPTQVGRHASTAKPIGALAPAFNAERFTDPTKVEKWFRRNCNDVVGRECGASEKADVMTWLLTLKP